MTTTNVWDKTEKMLHSLAGCRDSFELLVRFASIQDLELLCAQVSLLDLAVCFHIN